MKKKQVIRLTESDLHKIIKESVNDIIMNVKLSDCIKKLMKQGYSQQGAESLIRKAINNNEWKYLHKIIFDKN